MDDAFRNRITTDIAIPLVQVRDFARHANLATTMGYMHTIPDAGVTTSIGEALRAA